MTNTATTENNNNLITLKGYIEIKKCRYDTEAIFCNKKYEDKNGISDSLLVPNNKTEYEEGKGTPYKYRPYFKAVKKGVEPENENLLTFIMFNPSTTHQYSLDPTVNNCLELAERTSINGIKFNGIEVLNLLNIRNPKIDNINICDSGSNKDCEITPTSVHKNVVLAWGSRNFCNQGMNILNENLQKFKQYSQNTEFYTLIENKTIHPGNQAWSRHGGFNKAKLFHLKVTSFNELKILNGGELCIRQ